MIPQTWIIAAIAGGLAVIGIFWGGVRYGTNAERADRLAADLARAERVIKVTQVVKEIETRVVTQYRDRIQVIERNSGEAIEIIRRDTPADCVLPRDFSLRLHVAAGGDSDSAPDGGANAPETYDCRTVLAAIAQDYAAAHGNAAQIAAINAWASSIPNIGKQ